MTTKRLAIIGNQAFGMRTFRGPLIEHLVANGVEVLALAPDYGDADRLAISALGAKPFDYPLRRASISPFADLMTLRELINLLRELRPDVVLSCSAKPAVFGTLAAACAGVPARYAMLEGLGHAFIETPGFKAQFLRGLVGLLYRTSLPRTTLTLFLNDDDRREFVEGGLIGHDKAMTVGAIGVDLDIWRHAPPVVDPLTFVFVGRLLREKGIIEYIDAARRVRALHPAVRFLVLGAPDTNPSSVTLAQAQAWVEEGLIDWPGHVEIKTLVENASVFVLPSYREGVPHSTQQALAMGKPVITTNVPGCRETIIPGVNGLLVEPRDVQGLFRAMMSFVADKTLVSSMGSASRRLAEARFDVRSANARLARAMQL